MTKQTFNSLFIAIVLGLAGALSGCDIDQESPGELPEVEVQEGELPEYDVDTAEIDVDTERRTVDVPEVDIGTEEREIEVPDVDIIPPEADENEAAE